MAPLGYLVPQITLITRIHNTIQARRQDTGNEIGQRERSEPWPLEGQTGLRCDQNMMLLSHLPFSIEILQKKITLFTSKRKKPGLEQARFFEEQTTVRRRSIFAGESGFFSPALSRRAENMPLQRLFEERSPNSGIFSGARAPE